MKISRVFDDFVKDEIVLVGLSSKTEETYRCFYHLVLKNLGDVDVDKIDVPTVRKLRENLSRYQKPDTVRGYVVCLRVFLKYCQNNGINLSINIDNIKVPRREKRKIDILTEEEVAEFIELAGMQRRGYCHKNLARNVAIMKTLYSSGIRVGELCALNRNSIKNRQFTVIGKSKEPRLCFINNEAEEAIEHYLDLRSDANVALFISSQNEERIRSGNVREIFKNTCDISNGKFVNVHPHTLRHCFATKMLDRRVDIRYIGAMMGHASLDTTKIYTHYSDPKLREIYENANV